MGSWKKVYDGIRGVRGTEVDLTSLPPGYKLQVREGSWRSVDPRGFPSIRFSSADEAIREAWLRFRVAQDIEGVGWEDA